MQQFCPICYQELAFNQKKGYSSVLQRQVKHEDYYCFNPTPDNPLHYYSHIIDDIEENTSILGQEFTLDLGHKSVFVINNFETQKTSIKTTRISTPLELNFLIPADFPDLSNLKKKISLAIAFS